MKRLITTPIITLVLTLLAAPALAHAGHEHHMLIGFLIGGVLTCFAVLMWLYREKPQGTQQRVGEDRD